MTYVAAAVYDLDGNFRGYTTLNHETNKLKSTNLWSQEEAPKLEEQLARLNVGNALAAHWPSVDDPEVMALLNDPNWEPLEMVWDKAVDDDRSTWVWEQVPEFDLATGQPTGRMINGNLDEERSIIVYKDVQVPAEPVKARVRTQRAREIVARKRAGMTS